ncbi:hypothetical protein STEG23_031968, partial [Scotinomys teguina]
MFQLVFNRHWNPEELHHLHTGKCTVQLQRTSSGKHLSEGEICEVPWTLVSATASCVQHDTPLSSESTSSTMRASPRDFMYAQLPFQSLTSRLPRWGLGVQRMDVADGTDIHLLFRKGKSTPGTRDGIRHHLNKNSNEEQTRIKEDRALCLLSYVELNYSSSKMRILHRPENSAKKQMITPDRNNPHPEEFILAHRFPEGSVHSDREDSEKMLT